MYYLVIVSSMFSITLRSLKNGDLRKDNETRMLKTLNQPGPASETLHYLPVMFMGEAKGEGSCQTCLVQAIWVQQLPPVPLFWLVLLLPVPAELGKGLGGGGLCPPHLCACQHLPPFLYSALPASVLAKGVKVMKYKQEYSKITQKIPADSRNRLIALLISILLGFFCPFCFCFALSLFDAHTPWALLGTGAQM